MANETMIRVACPQCGKTYDRAPSYIGSQQKCYQCGLTFTVEAAPTAQSAQPNGFVNSQPAWTPPAQRFAQQNWTPQQNYAAQQMQQPYGYQPAYPQQQGYQAYPYQRVPTSGSAVAAMILGICAILFYPLGVILGPLALHYGRKGVDQCDMEGYGGRGMGTAGRVTGIIGIVFSAIFWLATIASGIAAAGHGGAIH